MVRKKLRVITRPSNLALAQVSEVMADYPDLEYEIIKINSIGDKDKNRSLMSKVPEDFFTRELDQALSAGRGDIVIHSAKDLPFPLAQDLDIIALTPAEDKRDCLVSRNNLKLKELLPGASIGTSSKNREEQICKTRSNLKIIAIRGTIEERLALITSGSIDALVVAACALKRLGLENNISEILPFKTHPLQGHLAILAKQERADLKVIFSPSDIRLRYGKVFLVGLGNGEPGLMTFKAKTVLEQTNIIFYDDLIDKSVMESYDIDKVYVGKRKGKHSFPQDEINELLYRAAIKGDLVVRLKSGDPFIFGRGGEELNFLRERMVSVEVIPGINSASLSAASIGIPLTMRGISNELHFLSGYNLFDSGKTQVYYMGASKLEAIKKRLLEEGNKPEIPVALIQDTGRIDEKLVITNIENMDKVNIKSPAIIIIGKVVQQYQPVPKILFTGLNPFSCKLPGKIIQYSLIETEIIAADFRNIDEYQAIVFTSKTAVKAFCIYNKINKEQKIIAIGPHTEKELGRYGYQVDYLPQTADSGTLAFLIKKLGFKKVLYPCSNISNNALHRLKSITKIIVYKTKPRLLQKVDLKLFSGIVFSSSSTIDAFFKIYNKIPENIVVYVYGRHSAKKMKEKGYEQTVQTLQVSQGG